MEKQKTSAPFTIRPYCEGTDFESLYQYCRKLIWNTIAYQLHGAAPDDSRQMVQKRLSPMNRNISTVVDPEGRAIGCVFIHSPVRVAWYRSFYIVLWERQEQMSQILWETLATIFSNPRIKQAVCVVQGYDGVLAEACRRAGMEQVGCVPDYCVYDGKVYPEFTFALQKTAWQTDESE